MSAVARATVSGMLAIAMWSSLPALTVALRPLPPFQQLAVTFAISSVAGIIWLTVRGAGVLAAVRQPIAALALAALALFGYHALYFTALQRAPAIEASLINYLWPLLIVLFAAFLPGERLRATQFAGCLFGLAAAVLLITRGGGMRIDPRYVTGYLAALAAALTWAGYSVLNRRFASVPSTALVAACALVALLGAMAHRMMESWVDPTPLQWLIVVALGLGPVGAAFALWDHGTKHGDIAVLGTLSYAAPVLSTLLLLSTGQASWHWTLPIAVGLMLIGAWFGVRRAKSR